MQRLVNHMKKLTVTIGIPTYNEENNIKQLLLSLLKQKEDGFVVKKIVVISDGSTDKTNQLVNSIENKKVKLQSYAQRGGKPKRINQLFKTINSDVIVLLDADIKLKNRFVLKYLVKHFIKQKDVMVTSGEAFPLLPTSFFEKIIYTGAMLWKDTIHSIKEPNIYQCEGEIRAFRKLVYKEMQLPMRSAEDVYPYLYCVKNNFLFKHAKDATVYYKLPTNLYDYIHQMSRFLGSKKTQQKKFDKKTADSEYKARFIYKVNVVLKNFVRNPLYISLYLLLLCIPRLNVALNKPTDRAKWKIISSSKRLNTI